MDEVAGIEAETEERIAEMVLDQRVDLAAGDADADGFIPIGGAGEIRRRQAIDVVVDSVRQPAGVLDQPAGPAG